MILECDVSYQNKCCTSLLVSIYGVSVTAQNSEPFD